MPASAVPGFDDCCDLVDTGPPPHLVHAVEAVQLHAFTMLLTVATGPGWPTWPRPRAATPAASQAIFWLESHGRLERDGDRLVGSHGLTTRPTRHAFTIGERRVHTWCAYDAMAIPVALGATARAETTCPPAATGT